jgi:stage II sporulation protein D
MKSPEITVGIMFQPSIEFVLDGAFAFGGKEYSGSYQVTFQEGKIAFEGALYDKLTLDAANNQSTFLLKDVVIGIGFHWERKEDQRFEGNLDFIVEDGKLTAINRVSVERYLVSVISSEMSATSSLELLKAHAVISRSWMLSQIQKRTALEKAPESYISDVRNNEEWIKWWDREDHTNFDVCADDHCQRYQGITRASQSLEMVEKAIAQTFGEMLMNGELICDARFSKCCGGAVEEFDKCWEPVKHPYLVKLYDNPEGVLPDLTVEENAQKWIRTSPAAFCNTTDTTVLSQVLNNYDQETTNFYRWTVKFDTQQMGELVNRRIGVDFGTIQELIPIERGTSGRIIRLKVVGSKQTLTLGKELLIRKAFSESHLYSSAFVIDKTEHGFTFTGAGWGHGVGLCQIGAAVMAHNGYPYHAILNHYFPTATIEKKY